MSLRPRIPVILDTDIDDTWALAQLIRCPELDVKLGLTASGNTPFRAKIAAKFLEAAGRTAIPVGIGVNGPLSGNLRNQGPWVEGYEHAQYPGEIVGDGIGRLIEIIETSSMPLTIAIAPSFNLAAALARAPVIAARSRLVGMFGCINAAYDGVLRALIENYRIFAPRVDWMDCDFFAVRSTLLFDRVAVYLAYAEDPVETETVLFRVTDHGFTVADAAGPFFCTRRVTLPQPVRFPGSPD